MKFMVGVQALVLTLPLGCASFIPDWNARPKGLHSHHEPQLMAWTVPRWSGRTGDVRVFFRLNHYADKLGAITQWDSNDPIEHKPDYSWVLDREDQGPGRHRCRIWIVRDGETFLYEVLWVRLWDKLPEQETNWTGKGFSL